MVVVDMGMAPVAVNRETMVMMVHGLVMMVVEFP